jgi:hypothetical protein
VSKSGQETGIAFLTRLLGRAERLPNRTRPASAAPDYDSLGTAEMMARFQAQMESAERHGSVTIRRGRRERSHLIDRVNHLGRTPSAVAASRQRAELEASIAGAAPWVVAILDEIERRWSRGRGREPVRRASRSNPPTEEAGRGQLTPCSNLQSQSRCNSSFRVVMAALGCDAEYDFAFTALKVGIFKAVAGA